MFNETKREISIILLEDMASESPPPSTDDFLSLEDLVRETPPSGSAQGPAVAESVATIDKVLEVEDPAFATELKALKDAGASPEADVIVDSDVDQLLQAEKVENAAKGRKKIRLLLFVRPWRKFLHLASVVKALGPWLKLTAVPALKDGAKQALAALKLALAWMVIQLKAGLSWFGQKSKASKLLFIAVLILAAAAIAMTRIALRGPFLPKLEKDFLTSFADGADQSFTYEEDEKTQNLNDPLLHPEHMILLERLIVNLRAPGDGSNRWRCSICTSKLAHRNRCRDQRSRQRSAGYGFKDGRTDELRRTRHRKRQEQTQVFLRKNLNDLLSQGRVRRLFFKSIVLKP